MLDMVKRDVSWACIEKILNVQGFFSITCEKKARKSREDMIEYGVWNIST